MLTYRLICKHTGMRVPSFSSALPVALRLTVYALQVHLIGGRVTLCECYCAHDVKKHRKYKE